MQAAIGLTSIALIALVGAVLILLRQSIVDARGEHAFATAYADIAAAIRFAETMHPEDGRLFLREWLEMTPDDLRREWPAWAAFRDDRRPAR